MPVSTARHTTTEIARRITQRTGRNCRPWMIRRVYDYGDLPQPERIGAWRMIPEGDIPKLIEAMESRGYLPAVDAAR